MITTIHKNLQKDDLREAFALLKQEIANVYTISEKVRNRTVRAIEDAEEEASDETTNVDTIKNSLERVKDTLEDAGEVYDSAKSWGKRLSDLVQTLVKYFPTIAGWINSL